MRKMKWIMTALIALPAIAACGGEGHWALEDDFGDLQALYANREAFGSLTVIGDDAQLSASIARSRWDELGEEIFCGSVVVRVHWRMPWLLQPGQGGIATWRNNEAKTERTFGEIWVNSSTPDWDLDRIVRHEIGHTLGWQHVDGTIMQETYWAPRSQR